MMTERIVLRGGHVIDGTGTPSRRDDVLVEDERIAVVGEVSDTVDAQVLDVTGRVVTPGFINVLSHAWGSLQTDPTGASDLLQGVTTEVFGEGFSPGPTDPGFADTIIEWAGLDGGGRVDFPRLSDGLAYIEKGGTALNVASFLGGANLRHLAAGFSSGPATAEATDRVRGVIEEEMQEGALGIGTALIYPPGGFAGTDELVAWCEVVGRYGGTYTSHLRSEGDRLLDGIAELVEIGRRAGVRAEVHHLKAAGRGNWSKMQSAIDAIEAARHRGQDVTANMYPYTAGATALASAIPPRFHDGGPDALTRRLADPAARRAMAAAMSEPADDFENLFLGAGADGILFFTDLADGTPARGRRLSEIAADLSISAVEAVLEIVARERGRMVAYFLMDEANVRLGLQQPWVSIGSDAPAHQAVAPFTAAATHPRTYGAFARFLGHYTRDESLVPLPEAVRRMTSLPADGLGLRSRGRLVPGSYADVAVFSAGDIRDHSTYENPHQYATGVDHVLVNGTLVVSDAQLTHTTPGRRLRRGA